MLATAGPAWSHEFEIHVLPPTDDWCEVAQRLAVPGDVLQLEAGHYPGGCELYLGGEVEKNEPLAVQGAPEGGTVIDADARGLSLRITGEPTRLYLIATEGSVRVEANLTSIDRCELACLDVEPGLPRITLLNTRAGAVDLEVGSATLRGNQLQTAVIQAEQGLVLENTVFGTLDATVPAVRNLVFGDLAARSDASGNVVLGTTLAHGALDHNTLVGPIYSYGTARNNLTVDTELPPVDGNLRCEDCLVDLDALDVQPSGEALLAPIVPVEPAVTDYCLVAPTHVGAVGLVGEGWDAFDRDLFGCSPGLVVDEPTAPQDTCPSGTTEPYPTGDTGPGTTDTGHTGHEDPSADVQLVDDAGGCGCDAAARTPWSWLPLRRPR